MPKKAVRRKKRHIAVTEESAQTQSIYCQDGVLYTIQPGDTIFRVARRFDVSIDLIVAANPQVDPEHPVAGELLCIPAMSHQFPRTGRRCMTLKHTLGSATAEGAAYLNFRTNVVLLVAAGLPGPGALQTSTTDWMAFIHNRTTDAYQRTPLIAGPNGTYSARFQVEGALSDFDDLFISAEDEESDVPLGRRALVANLDLSCGPF